MAASNKHKKHNHVQGISRFCNTMKETTNSEEAELIGATLPQWAQGLYLRTGPGLFDLEECTMHHLLDGYAMLTKFEITSNRVILSKKYLQSDSYRRAIVAKKPVITEFATGPSPDPNEGFLSRVKHAFSPEFTDNNSSNIVLIDKDIYTFGDTCFFHRIDPENLATAERYDTNKLFGLNVHTAHPTLDSNGDIWNIGYTIFTGLKFHILKIPPGKTSLERFKNSRTIATVSSRWTGAMASVHSFGVTDKYIVLVEQPFVVSAGKIAASILKRDSVKEWMDWNEKERNRFVIVSKTGSVHIQEYLSNKPFHFLHVINAFEDDNNQIIVDINAYPSPSYMEALYLSKLRADTVEISDPPQVLRFVIPIFEPHLKTDKIPENTNLLNEGFPGNSAIRQNHHIVLTPDSFPTNGIEMTTINPQSFARRYNIIYGTSCLCQSQMKNKICKYNIQSKEMLFWKQDEFTYPIGEPLFIPNPEGVDEDDGIVICVFVDIRPDQKDFILFLDKDMTELCRATFDEEIPIAFHGIFLKSQPQPSAGN